MTTSPNKRLPRIVVALGLVSLFTDLSSEMIVPLLPAFLTVALGASATFFGLVEGIAETVASLLKLLSGAWSDRLGKRFPLVLFGYSLSSLMRPLMALCTAPWHALLVRSADRIGKGLRSAPRDALLTMATEPASRGRAFGFHRAMDHTGALFGALLAMLLLTAGLSTKQVFAVAAIPGVFAVLAIVFGVKEQKSILEEPKEKTKLFSGWASFHPSLRRYLIVLGVFTLANSSDAFLLLKAHDAGIPLKFAPVLWMLLHATKIATNLFGGSLADRIGPLPVIRYGWLVYGLVYLLFGFATAHWQIWSLFALYGLYHGLTEGAEKLLVSRLSHKEHRGAAFGAYHALIGLMALPASLWMGVVWDRLGSSAAFEICAILSVLAAMMLRSLREPAREQ